MDKELRRCGIRRPHGKANRAPLRRGDVIGQVTAWSPMNKESTDRSCRTQPTILALQQRPRGKEDLTGWGLSDRANGKTRKVVRLVGQDHPGRVGAEELCPPTIRLVNGERAKTDGHSKGRAENSSDLCALLGGRYITSNITW